MCDKSQRGRISLLGGPLHLAAMRRSRELQLRALPASLAASTSAALSFLLRPAWSTALLASRPFTSALARCLSFWGKAFSLLAWAYSRLEHGVGWASSSVPRHVGIARLARRYFGITLRRWHVVCGEHAHSGTTDWRWFCQLGMRLAWRARRRVPACILAPRTSIYLLHHNITALGGAGRHSGAEPYAPPATDCPLTFPQGSPSQPGWGT